MKKIILVTVGMATLFSSVTVLAGPDFYVIEKARAAKHAEVQHEASRDARTIDAGGRGAERARN